MADIPILYTAAMVRALLREVEAPGTGKTKTRRLAWREKVVPANAAIVGSTTSREQMPTPWQRVKPGDRLWVRENHRLTDCACTEACRGWGHVWYDADASGYENVAHNRLRPSIHMPRWASRLTLVVTATKIERLQAITEDDARAEGVEYNPRLDPAGPCKWRVYDKENTGTNRAAHSFESLWNALHGPGAWDANPEVVALTFTVHKANIDAMREAA